MIVGPFGEGFLADSYVRAFEANGCQVVRFDSDRAYFHAASYARARLLRRVFRRRLWDRMNRATLAAVRSARPDVVLVFKGAFLDPRTIEGIRRDLPVINYYPDNPYCGVPLNPYKTSAQRRDLIDCLRAYTSVYIWSPCLATRLAGDGVQASYLPFGADPLVYGPASADPSLADSVVLVGQRNAKRDHHLAAIRRHQVTVWGPLWEFASLPVRRRHRIRPERVFGTLCAGIYASAAAALNVVDDLNMPGHNMRTFEIPASGGVMLSTYTKEQDGFFPAGEAAWYYRTPDELDDTLDRLLADKDGRERLRRNAAGIAERHQYRHRAAQILTDIFG